MEYRVIIGIIWVAVIAVVIVLGWLRGRAKDDPRMEHDFANCPICQSGRPFCDEGMKALGRRVPVAGIPGDRDSWSCVAPPRRIPMQSRFVPDATDADRADAMAEQIVSDQQALHEEHGEQVDVPAPGEEGYRPPSQYIPVSVGPYTVHLLRTSATTVSEARPDGAEWPSVEVPEAWEPVVVALAMEVLRLREGWTRPEETPA